MIDVLRAVIGEGAVREAGADDSICGVLPRAVVAPDSADACAALLATCSANGWRVEIAGGRTAGAWGRPVHNVDVLLSSARMSGITEYEPDDLTVGVAAGTTLAELRARLELNRQRVPLDPSTDRATVGGVLARAAAGPMRRAWATPRRQTLGLEVVTGDGRVLRVGGRVVKNVAGYDLNKLFVGSAGTLGVITRAHLRLLPLPNATATLALVAHEADALVSAARGLLAEPIEPAALELKGEPWRLIVRYEGAAEAVAAATDHLADVARGFGATLERADDAIARLAVAEADAALVIRLAHLPDRLTDTLEAARSLAPAGATFAAHAGDGIVRVIASAPDAARIEAEALARSIDAARASYAGSVTVERAPRDVMQAVEPWNALPDPVMKLTRELKRQFDPAGILHNGRWVA